MQILQTGIEDAVNDAISDAVTFAPRLLGALVIVVIGFVIGRILGGLVTRVLRRIGIDGYVRGTAVEEVAESDRIARVLGKIVSYYVYFVAILAAADVLAIDALSTLLADLGVYLPVVLGALVVLVVGFIIGRIVGDVVGGVVGGLGIGPYLEETPLEQFSERGAFGRIVGTAITYYIYLLTLLTVADIVEIEALSTLLNTFAGYLPALAAGLIVLLVGIWVAERVGRLVSESGDGRASALTGLVVKLFIYYITVTIALGTIGFETAVLTNLFTSFVVAFFGALALALAIGIGLAVGLGGQDYVAENIDDWANSAYDMLPEAEESDSVGE